MNIWKWFVWCCIITNTSMELQEDRGEEGHCATQDHTSIRWDQSAKLLQKRTCQQQYQSSNLDWSSMIGSDMTCLHCTHWPAAACKWLAVEAARCRPFHMYASSTLFCLLRTSMVYLPVNASLLMDHRPTRPTAPPLWAAWSIHPFSIWLPSTFCLKRWLFFLQQPAALLKVQVYATQLKHKHNHMIFVQKIKKL